MQAGRGWQAVLAVTAVFVLAIALVAPVYAQSGSTGGTLGKTGKSASGDDEAPARPAHKPVKRRAAADDGDTATAPAAGKSKTFENPTVNGVRLDVCMTPNIFSDCHGVAADYWCRSKGLSKASTFDWVVIGQTIRQKDKSICSSFCGSFTKIVCE